MGAEGPAPFVGYTGQIQIDGDSLVLSRKGIAAKVAGVGRDDRRIPLASVTAVSFKPAGRMTNGSLRLGLGGGEPATERDAASSPNSVVFTWHQREPFERLYTWLLSVVEINRASGLNSGPEERAHSQVPDGRDAESVVPPGLVGSPMDMRSQPASEVARPEPPTTTAGDANVESSGVGTDPRLPADSALLPGGSAVDEAGGTNPAAVEAVWAANWYADPTHRFQLRYWDGGAWTEHVVSDGLQGIDPLQHAASSIELTSDHAVSVTDVAQVDETPVEAARKPGMLARRREERHAKAAGRDEFESLARAAAGGDPEAMAALPAALTKAGALYRGGALEKKRWDTLAVAVRSVIDDDILTSEEEQHVHRLGEILGTPIQALERRNHALFEELVIAGINAGRFPRLNNPGMMLKTGEVAYASFNVSLMKEQAVRQYRAGTSSVSIPLGLGVRYRVAGVRGRSVVVGTELVVQDTGALYVTNMRTLFTGRAKTLEFRNDRLVGLEQFTDGLRLNVSNRQTASLFKMDAPSIAAALISAAVSHHT